jgi:hypothetical protein
LREFVSQPFDIAAHTCFTSIVAANEVLLARKKKQ